MGLSEEQTRKNYKGVKQLTEPTIGQTISINSGHRVIRVRVRPASLISSATYILPDNPLDGDLVRFLVGNFGITLLTLQSGLGGSTIFRSLNTFLSNEEHEYVFDAEDNMWEKIR